MYTTISKEATEAIARIIWDILDEWFGDTIIFDPIVVIPSDDLYDEPYIEVYSSYSRDPKVLDPHWQLALDECARPHLEELGVSGGDGRGGLALYPPTLPSPTPKTWRYAGDVTTTTGMRSSCSKLSRSRSSGLHIATRRATSG